MVQTKPKFTPPFAFGLYIILALQPLTLSENFQTRTVDGQVDRICYLILGLAGRLRPRPLRDRVEKSGTEISSCISFDMLRISPWVWRSGNL